MTCWEIFTCGKIPYPGVDPSELPTFLGRGRRLEKPENAACSDTMLAHTYTHTCTHTYITFKSTLYFELCHVRYTLILKCWDSDAEDRPSFTKITSTISKALQTMEGYLDMPAAGTIKVPATQDGTVLVKKNLVHSEFTYKAQSVGVWLSCFDQKSILEVILL